MFIHYADGASREGIILSLRADTMRIAVAGSEDVCEFVLRGHQWISGDLEVVSFSFPFGANWREVARAVHHPPKVSTMAHKAGRAIQ